LGVPGLPFEAVLGWFRLGFFQTGELFGESNPKKLPQFVGNMLDINPAAALL
jgi:hypothetical protein